MTRSCLACGPTLLPILVRGKELPRKSILDFRLDQDDFREEIAALAFVRPDIVTFFFKPLHGFEQLVIAHLREAIGEIAGIEVCLNGHNVTPRSNIFVTPRHGTAGGRGRVSQRDKLPVIEFNPDRRAIADMLQDAASLSAVHAGKAEQGLIDGRAGASGKAFRNYFQTV
jgi:hypothetical protein